MKPTGMDINFRIIRSTHAEDVIWEAVREAICANWTPEQFRREVAQAWESHLKDDIDSAKRVLLK